MGYADIVQKLLKIVSIGKLDEAVANARTHDIPELDKYNIVSGKRFLDFANWLVVGWKPTETSKGQDIYYVICIFYFILDQKPLGTLQTPINPESVGKALTPLSQWVVEFAQNVGSHLDKPESLNESSVTTFWNAPSFNLYEADESKTPGGKWKTFNDIFARFLKDGMRPIAEPKNDRIVVFPADSTFAELDDIKPDSTVVLKGLTWNVGDLLGSKYKDKYKDTFKGGVWMHTFLNTFDYHRQHSPVSGTVEVIDVIPGAAYLEVMIAKNPTTGKRFLQPGRAMISKSQFYSGTESTKLHIPDTPGYQFLQARGIIIINTKNLGKVAVLPIGMAQVSSVKVKHDLQGKPIEKGDEISHFEFGASDLVMLFEKKANVTGFPDPSENNHSNYGEKLCVSNY